MNTQSDLKLAKLIAQHECAKHWAPWTWYVKEISRMNVKKGAV
jgi:hypothetical protein